MGWEAAGVAERADVGVCNCEGEPFGEGEREKAERRTESPRRVEGRYTAPSPVQGKLGPAESPERRLTSSRPAMWSSWGVGVGV